MESGDIPSAYILVPNETLCTNFQNEGIEIGLSDKGKGSYNNAKVVNYSEKDHKERLTLPGRRFIFPDDKVVIASYNCMYNKFFNKDENLTTIPENTLIIVDEYHLTKNREKRILFDMSYRFKYLMLSATSDHLEADIHVDEFSFNFNIKHHVMSLDNNVNMDVTFRRSNGNIRDLLIGLIEDKEPNYSKPVVISNDLLEMKSVLAKLKYTSIVNGRSRKVPQFVCFGGQGRMFMKWYNSPSTDKTIFIIPSKIIEGISLHSSNVMMIFNMTANSQRLYQEIGRVCRLGNNFPTIHLFVDESLYFVNIFCICLEYIFDNNNNLRPQDIDVSVLDKRLSKINDHELRNKLDFDITNTNSQCRKTIRRLIKLLFKM